MRNVPPINPAQKVKVNKYTIQPELYGTGTSISTIGVFAHEFGHALGLPDLYDTDYTSEGVGNWSLMAGGSWNYSGGNGGNRPAHLDPDPLRRPFPVGDDHVRQRRHDLGEGGGEASPGGARGCRRDVARLAVCQHEDRVVGAHVAVDRDGVERGRDRGT